MDGWNYYHHALVPSAFPHETANTELLENNEIWKKTGAIFARWTTDFDCGEETTWWYIIKDDVFQIEHLKAKRRYEINKGKRNFEVRLIDPADYISELYQVQMDALSAYPEKYRKETDYSGFERWVQSVSERKHIQRVYAAFYRDTNEICGFVHVPVHERWAALSTLKTKPQYEKYAVNAVLVYGVLEALKERMDGTFYICDGPRNIQHETYFQDYLQKYFQFRKAYCKLHIKYRPGIGMLVRMIYPWRKLLKRFGFVGLVHQVNGVLKMEEIMRKGKN